jgi:acyl carrier protein
LAEAEELREYLKDRLPEYMVPSTFVGLESLPLTPNGKVDRRALPAPDWEGGEVYLAPRTLVEELLAGIWIEVLGVSRVGVHDNFFALGGHSLLATQVISRLRGALGVEVPLRRLFESPTIAALARSVEAALQEGVGRQLPPLATVSRSGDLPLSFAQERLWFLDQLEPESTAYNMPGVYRLSGRLEIPALAAALGEIVRRHEVLRTLFCATEGRPVQVIGAAQPMLLPVVDLGGLVASDQQEEGRRLTGGEARRPFHLSRGPLLRACLIRLAGEEHLALLTMHHIASDGWSMEIFTREVSLLYASFLSGRPSPLADLSIQYADFAHWQRSWLTGEVLAEELSHWREQLAGAPPALELPTDRPHPAVQTFIGTSFEFILPRRLWAELRALCRREGVTPFMLLLAGFQALLSRHSGQEDVIVGSPIAGRTRLETESLIGFFVNTLVLRTDFSRAPRFTDAVRRVRESFLEAHAHQDLPFEKLVEALEPERSLSRPPLFQVMFLLQNVPQQSLRLPGLTLSAVGSESRTAKFDLTLGFVESGEELTGQIEYNTDLFDRPTVIRLSEHLLALLEEGVEEPGRKMSELRLLGEAERAQLVVEWNDTAQILPERSIHELFEEQVVRSPESVAVVAGDERWTYCELNRRANRLAHRLIGHGVGP